MIRCAIGLKGVDADLLACMHIPPGLSPERFDMACVTACLTAEELVTPPGRSGIKVFPGLRLRSRQRELIKVQSRELLRNQMLVRVDMREVTESVCRSYRELHRIIQPRIEKAAFPVH